jgi:hypothetical protein
LADNNSSANSALHKGAPAQAQLRIADNPTIINPSTDFPSPFKDFGRTRYAIMGSIEQSSHFKEIQKFEADYADAKFTQYESQRTGLRVTVVDRKGPKVYGYFAVATEIHDDSGSRK